MLQQKRSGAVLVSPLLFTIYGDVVFVFFINPKGITMTAATTIIAIIITHNTTTIIITHTTTTTIITHTTQAADISVTDAQGGGIPVRKKCNGCSVM